MLKTSPHFLTRRVYPKCYLFVEKQGEDLYASLECTLLFKNYTPTRRKDKMSKKLKRGKRRLKLEETLLSIGGNDVVWPEPPVPHLAQLVARGRLFEERVRMWRCEKSQCHANSSSLWGRN